MIALEPPFAGDPRGMAAHLEGIPEQALRALENRVPSWPPADSAPALVAYGGMGGSAIAADLTAALAADRLPHPFLVVRDYRWPACVDERARAVLCSYSGNTEETLALYEAAAQARVPRVGLTSGGALASRCDRDGVPWIALPQGFPPRAALYSIWVPLTRLVHGLGGCEDPMPAWTETIAALRDLRSRIGIAVPENDNPAKQLARALAGRSVYVYSGTERTAAVATRFRQQLCENAKLPAHSAAAPELQHNEIVGWERATAFHRGLSVVLLRDREDAPEVATRLELTAEYATRQGARVHVVESPPGGRLARLASLVMYGDYVSFYLALATGVDPTPVASIDEFKRRLAEARARA